jgi:hypothetical protein
MSAMGGPPVPPYPPPPPPPPQRRSRRLWIVGGVALAAVAVVLAALFAAGATCQPLALGCHTGSTPVRQPCLKLSNIPAQSGIPSEDAASWCVNSTDTIVERMVVHLTITIGGSAVTIPGGIGEVPAGRWTFGGSPSQACDMPIFTDNSTGGGANSGGYIEIASPWAFNYTLGDFFSLWHDFSPTAEVDGTPQPVEYEGTQIFNYTTTTHQVVRLWVDGAITPATSGPGLDLNYEISSYDPSATLPSCFVGAYGDDHTLAITWGWTGSGE